MKRSQIFEAHDGATFATSKECKFHEQTLATAKLIGLSGSDLEGALRRDDVELANAIERIGTMIADKRRESGELRRTRKAPAAFENVEKAMAKNK
jgi:hypothetical protein